MEEDWYTVEPHIRDRLTEARAAARIRTLTQELAATARRSNSVGITIIGLANRVLAHAMQLPLELSSALANVRAATKPSRQEENGHHHVPRGHPGEWTCDTN